MAAHLFCYGSLTLAPVMRAVCGRVPASQPARLSGFACYALKGEPYPALVPRPGATVSGCLYLNLSPAMLARLDRYEGRQYLRRRVNLELANGRSVTAWTYVLRMRYYHRCSRRHWSLPLFVRNELKACLHRL